VNESPARSAVNQKPKNNDSPMKMKLSLFVRLEAKPGKEAELAAFLMQGLELARQEATTPVWFALRIGPSTFGVFDSSPMKPGGKPISTDRLRRRSWRRRRSCSRRRRSSNESRCSARNCRSRLDPEHPRTSWRPANAHLRNIVPANGSLILRREGAASPLVSPGSP